ncbi:CBS domain-containing protein [Corynebacterium uterequi]|uniref:CBS domain-containing protein n=1 Tax=Corynebacterium uterequi TaxID=1072256 RepID=A0A0G3HH29_9CORY|nr:CBS domain-containing protein [Corynebacterium uterequi]AKK11218.1 CBS domain-containing protein [Corynebacterium uterequi]
MTTHGCTHRPDVTPATRFLAAFNSIEQYLRSAMSAKDNGSIGAIAHQAEKAGLLSPQQNADFQEYRELRNAITHGEYRDFRPIADPREDVIAEIERLAHDIINQPELHAAARLDSLPRQIVRVFHPDDSASEVLDVVRTSGISQFPIYERKTYVGLLTTDAIAKWVSVDYRDDGRLDARTVSDILDYAGDADWAVFLPRSASLSDALAALTTSWGAQLPRAVIATQDGRRNQRPVRVISGADIALLMMAVNSHRR